MPRELSKLRSRLVELVKVTKPPQANTAEIELAKNLTRAIDTKAPITLLRRVISYLVHSKDFFCIGILWPLAFGLLLAQHLD
ncbi:hypothetical protein Pse7367_1735 [Thalassoporum mexicanum PCC 7367]|nr:hypothetical protein Pse7367_1735 [Pseudanabaena sp. PCC 7367]